MKDEQKPETTKPLQEELKPRQLDGNECARLIGSFIGGLCMIAPLENVRNALRHVKENLTPTDDEKASGILGLRLDLLNPESARSKGDITPLQTLALMVSFCASLGTCAVKVDILHGVEMWLDMKSVPGWAAFDGMRKIARGEIKICPLCGQQGHSSDVCPNVKINRSLIAEH